MLKVQRDRGIIKIFHGMFGIEQIVKGDFDPFACVCPQDAPEPEPRIVDSSEIVEIISGGIFLGDTKIKGFGEADRLGCDKRGVWIRDLPAPGQPGKVERMLLLVGAVQQPNDDLISRAGLKDQGGFSGLPSLRRITACVPRFSSLPLRTLWKVAPASSMIIAPNMPCIW